MANVALILCPACLSYVRLIPVGAGRFVLEWHPGRPPAIPVPPVGATVLIGGKVVGSIASVSVRPDPCRGSRCSIPGAFRFEHPGYPDALHLPDVSPDGPRQPPG